RKYGAEFTVPDGATTVHNIFADGLLPGSDYAYEVERAKFDLLLLDEARDRGCQIFTETAALGIRNLGDAWEVLAASETTGVPVTLHARWIIDAPGRDSFLAKRFQIEKEPLPYPRRLGIYAHFHGIPLQPGNRSGNIVITRLPDGWF